jgi:hypothetical protein
MYKPYGQVECKGKHRGGGATGAGIWPSVAIARLIRHAEAMLELAIVRRGGEIGRGEE